MIDYHGMDQLDNVIKLDQQSGAGKISRCFGPTNEGREWRGGISRSEVARPSSGAANLSHCHRAEASHYVEDC
ncbi:hypothetical protein HZ326_14485 [Fusarium oxysporum f. sp. albedinis]|nr:hypothetical protein HZ326_14485 [Fusarium oxysporum f. sp. albedinis]KAK2472263.1 hypothetical protein H9L39_16143 [Fusarium oxysporum f. sp. albedinis]